jgi:hypothetical protein
MYILLNRGRLVELDMYNINAKLDIAESWIKQDIEKINDEKLKGLYLDLRDTINRCLNAKKDISGIIKEIDDKVKEIDKYVEDMENQNKYLPDDGRTVVF